MKRVLGYYIVFTLLIFSNNLKGQFCTVNSQTQLGTLPNNVINATGPFTIRIYVHAISDSQNNLPSVTVEQIYASVNILQQAYQSCGICFSFKGYDFIDLIPVFYYDPIVGGTNNFITMDNLYHVPNCINIYIAPDILHNTSVSGGNALGIPGTALIIGGTFTNLNGTQVNSVASRSLMLAHEMGHCLGLHHTHHGSGIDGIPGGCPELVDGSNSTICGDYISDTPADPVLLWDCSNGSCGFISNCLFIPNTTQQIVDANGQQYTPDIHNVMAYTQVDCMTGLTSGQCSRCVNFIGNSAVLQSCLVPNESYIQNTQFSTGNHFYTTLNTLTAGSNVTNPPYGPVITTTSQTEFKSGANVLLMPEFLATPTSDYYFLAQIGNLCDPITQTNDSRLAQSSTYYPLLNTTKWIYCFNYIHGLFNDSIQYTGIDTNLLGNNYKVYSDYRFYLPGVYNDSSFGTGFNRYYFLREDTISKKVYLVDITSTHEDLLYDFSLNVGDTLPVLTPINGTYYLVSIDSVLINTEYRRRFNFESTTSTGAIWYVKWVEGIGNITNPMNNFYNTPGQYFTICVYENSVVLVDNTQTALYPPVSYDCSFLLSSNTEISDNVYEKFYITPNPFNNKLGVDITLYRPQKIAVVLYDVMGRLIQTLTNSNEQVLNKYYYNFDTTHLSPGIYLCIMKSEQKSIAKKIVKY